MDEDPKTEELRATQAGREKAERSRAEEAEEAEDPEEAGTHARRADKAAYLREKLEERAEAEREVDGQGS